VVADFFLAKPGSHKQGRESSVGNYLGENKSVGNVGVREDSSADWYIIELSTREECGMIASTSHRAVKWFSMQMAHARVSTETRQSVSTVQ